MKYAVFNALVLGMVVVALVAIATSFSTQLIQPQEYTRSLSAPSIEETTYKVRDIMWNVRGLDLVLQSVVIFATVIAVAALRREARRGV